MKSIVEIVEVVKLCQIITILSAVCLQFVLYFSGAMQSYKVGKQKPVTVFMPTELIQLREMTDSGKKI